MKIRMIRLTIVSIISMIGFALLGTMVALAAPVEHSATDLSISHPLPADTEIQALRLISIPYGIDDTLILQSDGHEIAVEGPGKCREGDEAFRIRVFVTQGEGNRSTQAKGRTEGDCSEVADGQWDTTAAALGRKTTFEPGAAHVRAMVVIFRSSGGADVGQWEKDVTLK